jgi:cytochrome c oxidase assembly factor CtaG
LVIIAIAVSPPVDDAADHSFSSHMLQHAVLIFLAAPLLAIAWPLFSGRWRAPLRWPAVTFLMQPAVAVALSTAALWLWHFPAAYDLALAHPAVHVLEHLSFFGAFLLYWGLLGGMGAPSRLNTNESRALYLLAGATLTAPLGAILTFSDQIIYTHYAAMLQPGGRSPLEDQQRGGAIMWLSGPLVYGLAAILTMREE